MKTKKHFCISIFILLFICFTQQIFSQPYYYYHGTLKETSGPVITPELWRFNFQTNTKELFFSDSIYYGAAVVSWDPTQQWIFLTQDNSYSHMNPYDYAMLTGVVNAGSRNIVHVFPDQYPHPAGTFPHSFDDHLILDKLIYDGIVYNPVKNVFYVTWFLPHPDSLGSWTNHLAYQRTAVYDATTFAVLDTLPVPPGWITAQASVSEDGKYLYLVKYQGQYPVAIGKYSLATKQLIINRNLSDVVVLGIQKGFADSKKGKYLIGYCYPKPQSSDGKYALYNIDLDTSVVIPFQEESDVSISSDSKYVIIEETPLKPDYLKLQVLPSELFLHPGRISVFNGVTGKLIQKLTLPPDGKVLVFDNYPNMLYYYLPNENRSINIDLSKPAVSITSLNPTNVYAGSSAFTLTVKGKNFISGSTINWNNSARTTTFIADSILQAAILASDVSVSGTASLSVTNTDGGTSNNLPFVIRQSYTLAINTIGNGSVTTNPNQTKYDSASVVQLTATSQQSSVFSGWTGDLTGTVSPAALIMNANKSVTATFVASLWTNKDIGNPALAGSTTITDGIFTVKGAGTDVGGTTDQFQYVYQALTGDGEIIAKVNSVTNTNTSAKAGVMIRESLNANSRFAFIMQRPDKQVQFDGRTSTGGTTVHISSLQGGTTNIKFLRIVRSGNLFSAYYSTSSATGPWTSLGTSTVTMTANVQMGLFVTSHNTSALCTAVFGQVVIPPVQYTLTTSVTGQGSISLTPSGGKYNIGTNVTVTATASSGWTFSNWSGDLTGITNPTVITMNGNKSVTATFIPIPIWTNDGPTTFDGTTTYVDGGTTPGSASNLTVSFFMTAHKLANMGPVDKIPTTGKAGWSVKLRSNGDLWFRIGSDGTKTDVTKTSAYSANTKVHIACTFGSGTAKIYVNGVLVTTKNSVTYTVNNTATHLRLGIPSVAATTDKFDGVLEQVKIYNQVLTDAQISGLAALGK